MDLKDMFKKTVPLGEVANNIHTPPRETVKVTEGGKIVDTKVDTASAKPPEVNKKKLERLEQKAKILKEYGNMPSNIPVNHIYWKL